MAALSLTDLAKRSTEPLNSAKVTSLFASVADADEIHGNFLALFLHFMTLILDIDLLSDSSMLSIIGDGLINDLLLSVYADIGMPLNKPYHLGYVTPTVSVLFVF